MSVREYAVLHLGTGGSKAATVGGGNTVITAGQHRLDGTEHLPAEDTTTLDATTTAHGLLPKLSGSSTDALRGDGTWGPVTSVAALDDLTDVIAPAPVAGDRLRFRLIDRTEALAAERAVRTLETKIAHLAPLALKT